MNGTTYEVLMAGIVALFLFVYLVYALFFPESF